MLESPRLVQSIYLSAKADRWQSAAPGGEGQSFLKMVQTFWNNKTIISLEEPKDGFILLFLELRKEATVIILSSQLDVFNLCMFNFFFFFLKVKGGRGCFTVQREKLSSLEVLSSPPACSSTPDKPPAVP